MASVDLALSLGNTRAASSGAPNPNVGGLLTLVVLVIVAVGLRGAIRVLWLLVLDLLRPLLVLCVAFVLVVVLLVAMAFGLGQHTRHPHPIAPPAPRVVQTVAPPP